MDILTLRFLPEDSGDGFCPPRGDGLNVRSIISFSIILVSMSLKDDRLIYADVNIEHYYSGAQTLIASLRFFPGLDFPHIPLSRLADSMLVSVLASGSIRYKTL